MAGPEAEIWDYGKPLTDLIVGPIAGSVNEVKQPVVKVAAGQRKILSALRSGHKDRAVDVLEVEEILWPSQ